MSNERLLEVGPKRGVDAQVARDIWITVESQDICHALLVNRGWSPARYQVWLAGKLERHPLG